MAGINKLGRRILFSVLSNDKSRLLSGLDRLVIPIFLLLFWILWIRRLRLICLGAPGRIFRSRKLLQCLLLNQLRAGCLSARQELMLFYFCILFPFLTGVFGGRLLLGLILT